MAGEIPAFLIRLFFCERGTHLRPGKAFEHSGRPAEKRSLPLPTAALRAVLRRADCPQNKEKTMNQTKTSGLLQGNILKSLVAFAFPVLLALFLQAMYGAADLIIVGQFADT